jgi:hypothetical protein
MVFAILFPLCAFVSSVVSVLSSRDVGSAFRSLKQSERCEPASGPGLES